MDKCLILSQISAHLREMQVRAGSSQKTAQKEANSHVGAMESRYDTFKEEAQYEVTAQEIRIRQYQDGINQIEALIANASNVKPSRTIRIGSVVVLESETTEEKFYILSPSGGGFVAKYDDTTVFTLTVDSPLGKQLIGLEVGDECELRTATSKTCYVIKEVF